MNKNDLRNVLAKLHELETPVEEVKPVVKEAGVLDFLRGLGAGETKAGTKVKPRVEPKLEPHVPPVGQGAEQVASAALSDANTKLSLLRKITPAEAAAAKAEGKTLDELLFNKYPETFAKFEKDPQLYTSLGKEFSKAADELMTAGDRGPAWLRPQEEQFGKKSLAVSALIHALIILGLLISKKSSDTSKEKTASSSTSDASNAGSSSQGASRLAPDEISWTALGINPKAYEGSALEKSSLDGQWKVVLPSGKVGGYITNPEMVKKIERLAAMKPEDRKNEKRAIDSPAYIISQDEFEKMKPAAPSAKAPADQATKDADIGITAKNKKEQENLKKKKKKEEPVPSITWGAN